MTTAGELRSGKGHKDENFPVASWIIHPRHRALILAFYNFVRTADDIADHATLAPQDKLDRLDRLEQSLLGRDDKEPEGVAVRAAFAIRSMPPKHAQDLLNAFRMDVTKLRYANWDELIHYCSLSAMPVGRFMLDVHGEDRSTWAANDKLCAALQINNHLQDCGKDYRALDRVYLPMDAMNAAGASVDMLAKDRASPELLGCLHTLARRTEILLGESRGFAGAIKDTRLALEVSVIDAFADKIVKLLKVRDPLSENVHLSKQQMLASALTAMVSGFFRRATAQGSVSRRAA
jgi:squalene synthase HpnC